MNWLYYVLEANLYLLIFYGFYRLFLQHETFYNANRYYLLLTSATAFVLPILQLGFLKPVTVVDPTDLANQYVYGEALATPIPVNNIPSSFNFIDYLYPLYLFIAVCFAFKLGMGISKIISIWIHAKKLRRGQVTVVELSEPTAFSFFNLLFIHPSLANKPTVLNHEMVHIRQKHSFDVMFFEVLHIICWFNPVLYFIKKDIKLLHEYIADELSTTVGVQKHEYVMLLIENSLGLTPTALTNQIFNQSILKRRINMLNKKRTAGWARLKLLAALPLTGAMLCISTMGFTKDYGYVELLPEKSTTTLSMFQNPPQVEETKKQKVNKTKVSTKSTSTEKVPTLPKTRTLQLAQDHFYPAFTINEKTKAMKAADSRYILVNGKHVKDMNSFYGVKNAEKVVLLNRQQALAKYGSVAPYGAVEITGSNIQWVKSTEVPPRFRNIVRFPPPKIKFRKIDTVTVNDLKVRPDSIKTLTLKLKPTLRTIPLKASKDVRLKTINVVPTRVVSLNRKADTLRIAMGDIKTRFKTQNVQIRRDFKTVNLQLDTLKSKPVNLQLKVEKKGKNGPQYEEVILEPSTKN